MKGYGAGSFRFLEYANKKICPEPACANGSGHILLLAYSAKCNEVLHILYPKFEIRKKWKGEKCMPAMRGERAEGTQYRKK